MINDSPSPETAERSASDSVRFRQLIRFLFRVKRDKREYDYFV